VDGGGGNCWRRVLVGQCAVVWWIGGVTVVMVRGSSHQLKRLRRVDIVVSAAATSPSTRVLGLVAKVLTTIALGYQTQVFRPLFFTFVISAAATSPSTRILGLVAAALTTKVKNKGSSPGPVIYTCTAPFRSAYVTL
jgi:hypothetical protein